MDYRPRGLAGFVRVKKPGIFFYFFAVMANDTFVDAGKAWICYSFVVSDCIVAISAAIADIGEMLMADRYALLRKNNFAYLRMASVA